jgi:hypothetical protein
VTDEADDLDKLDEANERYGRQGQWAQWAWSGQQCSNRLGHRRQRGQFCR